MLEFKNVTWSQQMRKRGTWDGGKSCCGIKQAEGEKTKQKKSENQMKEEDNEEKAEEEDNLGGEGGGVRGRMGGRMKRTKGEKEEEVEKR